MDRLVKGLPEQQEKHIGIIRNDQNNGAIFVRVTVCIPLSRSEDLIRPDHVSKTVIASKLTLSVRYGLQLSKKSGNELHSLILKLPLYSIEITVKLDGKVYIGESIVEVDNLVPRLNAITDQNTEARIYVRGDRVVAYGRVMAIMSKINSAGYTKVALVAQNPSD